MFLPVILFTLILVFLLLLNMISCAALLIRILRLFRLDCRLLIGSALLIYFWSFFSRFVL